MGCANCKSVDDTHSPNRSKRNQSRRKDSDDEESDHDAPIGFTDMQGHVGEQNRRRRAARMTSAQREKVDRDAQKATREYDGMIKQQQQQQESVRQAAVASVSKVPVPSSDRETDSPHSQNGDAPPTPMSPKVAGKESLLTVERQPGHVTDNAITMVPTKKPSSGAELVHQENDTAMAMLRGKPVGTSGPAATAAAKPRASAQTAASQPKRQFFFMED